MNEPLTALQYRQRAWQMRAIARDLWLLSNPWGSFMASYCAQFRDFQAWVAEQAQTSGERPT
jgi:hypothetical protein